MIHLIGFYTQGVPHDRGLNLTKHAARFKQIYEPYVDFIEIYNTENTLKLFPEFKESIRSLPAYCSFRGWGHHFWKWKPFILHEHLKTMDYGDLLIYHDCNLVKYKEYELGAIKLREHVNIILKESDLVGTIDPKVTNQQCAKPEIFQTFGNFQDKPVILTNRIFLRKTKQTEKFIEEWLHYCNGPLLLPDKKQGEEYVHTCDQAIFNGLYYQSYPVPTVYLKNNTLTRENLYFLKRQSFDT